MKQLFTLTVAVLVSVMSFGQATTLWELNADNGNRPAYIGTGSLCRNVAFGIVNGNKRLYVPSREGGAFVHILNPETGATIGQLPMGENIVTGGLWILNAAGVSEDGVIIASNMANAAGSFFKAYAWKSESSDPVNVLNAALPSGARLGDKISVSGNFLTGTAKLWAPSWNKDGSGNAVVYVYSMTEDTANPGSYVFNNTPQVITIGVTGVTDYTVPGVAPKSDGSFFWTNMGASIRYIDQTGFLTENAVPGSIAPIKTSSVRYMGEKNGQEYLAYFLLASNCAEVISFATGDVTTAKKIATTTTIGKETNGNNTADLAVNLTGEKPVVYLMVTNNGIGAYEIDLGDDSSIRKISTSEIQFTISDNQIQLEGTDAKQIELISVSGQKVRMETSSSNISTLGLKGVYILKVTDYSGKRSVAKVSL